MYNEPILHSPEYFALNQINQQMIHLKNYFQDT